MIEHSLDQQFTVSSKMLYYSKKSFVPLIFYLSTADFQRALAIILPLDIRQQSMCSVTITEEVVTTLEEAFILTFTVDGASTSSMIEPSSPTWSSTVEGGVFWANPTSVKPTTATVSPATGTASASIASSSTTSAPPGSSSGYAFDAESTENVAVYFGQSAATGGSTLRAQCADPNIDIVILAFVVSRNDSGLYPGVNFGAACGGQTPLMEEQAPGLLSCTELATDINVCQATYGKKVLLSVGGGGQSIIFNTESDASAFASILWDLFGPPGNIDADLRPFGNATVDGFDIDNEDNNSAYYEVLGSTFRTLFSSSISKSFYLSAAPQCPNPDASDPSSLLLLCDFVWVQFYNNPPCEIGTSGFNESLRGWSQTLSSSKARLYLGAPAWLAAGPTAYISIGSAQGIEVVAKNVKSLGIENFGGVMFWDGPEGMLNQDGGKDIIAWAKTGLIA